MHGLQAVMAAAGITGVKVDCQAGVGLIGSAMGGGPAVAQQYHLALEESIRQHFPTNDCINCMCHSTENFYRQVINCFIETALLPFAWQTLAVPQPYKCKQSASTVTCFQQLSVSMYNAWQVVWRSSALHVESFQFHTCDLEWHP